MIRGIQYSFLGLALCLCNFCSFGQQDIIDSLLSDLKIRGEDTGKVNTLNRLAWKLQVDEKDKAIEYTNQAIEIGRKINYQKGIAWAYNTFGNMSFDQGNYPEALRNHSICLKIMKEIGFKKGQATSYNNIGIVYFNQGNYFEALNMHNASLKIVEEIGDKNGIVRSYNNIGNIYYRQGNYPEGLKNYFNSLKMAEVIGDYEGQAIAYNNIGNIYTDQGNYPEALKSLFASLKIADEMGDKKGKLATYNNIGNIYFAQRDNSEAMKNYFISLKIGEEIGDKPKIALAYKNIGNIYADQGNYNEALKNYTLCLKIEEEVGDKDLIACTYNRLGALNTKSKKYKEAKKYLDIGLALSKEIWIIADLKETYSNLAQLDSAQGNYKGAYSNYKMYVFYRDSLVNEDNTKKTVQAAMQYEFDKKETEAKTDQEKKDVLTAAEKRKQKIVLIFVIFGLLSVAVFAVFVYRSLRITRKQKNLIEIKSKETEIQKKVIEEKNKEITDSINYAKRIQQAKLPRKEEISAFIPESFVLYKPKDIVSGDFYWFYKQPASTTVFLAAADCTGHGVPGAFMSMIGSEKLDDAIMQSTNTSEILSHLNKGIKNSLKQSANDESTRDGMDIALCAIDTVNRVVKYAAANRPIYIVKKGAAEVQEIKATKKAIGGFTEDEQYFETHTIQLQKDDTFYLTTDGYGDTFGGEIGKKVTTKRFKQILVETQNKSMKEQEQHLESFIESWKDGTEQVDDILVIGVRL